MWVKSFLCWNIFSYYSKDNLFTTSFYNVILNIFHVDETIPETSWPPDDSGRIFVKTFKSNNTQ